MRFLVGIEKVSFGDFQVAYFDDGAVAIALGPSGKKPTARFLMTAGDAERVGLLLIKAARSADEKIKGNDNDDTGTTGGAG